MSDPHGPAAPAAASGTRTEAALDEAISRDAFLGGALMLRQPRVLLVCDAGNAMVRMIEAVLQRKYPQIEVTRTLTLREYELAETISEDFVIATARVSEKSKPVVMIAPFPTDY